MKLTNIYEAAGSIASGGTPVLNISKIFGQLIDIFYNQKAFKDSKPAKLLKSLFKKPNADSWTMLKEGLTTGVIEILSTDVANKEKYKDLFKSLLELKTYAPSIITSSLYAIEPKYLLKTDLKALAQNTPETAKTMLAMQPSGWVATFANTDGISKSQLKDFRKKIRDDGKKISKDVSKYFPGPQKKKF